MADNQGLDLHKLELIHTLIGDLVVAGDALSEGRALPVLARVGKLVDEAKTDMVVSYVRRRHWGGAWADIGQMLGVTKQAAHKRWAAAARAAGETR